MSRCEKIMIFNQRFTIYILKESLLLKLTNYLTVVDRFIACMPSHFCRVWLFAPLYDCGPLSSSVHGNLWVEYWSQVVYPPQEILATQDQTHISLCFRHRQEFLPLVPPGNPWWIVQVPKGCPWRFKRWQIFTEFLLLLYIKYIIIQSMSLYQGNAKR